MLKRLHLLCLVAMMLSSGTGYSQSLIHYWNFNNSATELDLFTPTASLVPGASISHVQGGMSLVAITGNTGSGFDITNPNARNGDAALTHIRFNNPIGGTLVFKAPTTGYQQVVVKFGTRRSGSGAGTQKVEYTTDGINYDSFTVIIPIDGDPTVQTLDFSGIAAVNNNPDFGFRITFSQGTGGLVGNNRFDNLTLEGNTFGADNVPPTVAFTPVDGSTGVSPMIQPTITFNEDVRLVSNQPILDADIAALVEFRQDSATGAPVSFTGTIVGRTITIVPTTSLANSTTFFVSLKPNVVEDASDNAVTVAAVASFSTIQVQTVFAPGDIVPVAYRMNTTSTGDEVAFVTFVDILPGTVINLTDAKYTDNAQPQCPGGIMWTSPASILPSGTVFVIQNDAGTASAGTVTGSTFGLSSGGDQVMVYTGSAVAPGYVTAISSNAWLVNNTVCNGSLSKIPAGLTDGVNAINLSTTPGNVNGNTVNAYYNGTQAGTVAELKASILNPLNWIGVGGGTAPQVWPVWNFPGPPQVTEVSVLSQNSLRVVFNRDLNAASASNLANYTGIPTLFSVNQINNSPMGDTLVLLFDNTFVNGNTYTLEISGVKDTDNRTMLGVYTYTFTYSPRIGFVTRFASVAEDAGSVSFDLFIDNPLNASVKLVLQPAAFNTADNQDVNFSSQVLTITGNSSAVRTISLPIIDDNILEQDEYFVLGLEDANGIAINGAPFFTVFIRDNDRTAPVATKAIELEFKARYNVPNPTNETGLAEIVAYDQGSKRLFTISTALGKYDIVNFSDPENPVLIQQVDMSPYGLGITSVAVKNGLVAVSVPGLTTEQENGAIVFFDVNGNFLKQVAVGALPDMITFTPDGNYLLAANEGQPNDAYTIDPEGSVSMINLQGGIANLTQADVTTISFESFNSQEAALLAAGVRKTKASSTLAQDFEPEYITVSPDSKKAWVILQENNSMVEINLETKTTGAIWALGTKDYKTFGNGLDVSDQGGFAHIANWPLKGYYMPDGIANFTEGGVTYIVTANEGDEKEYAGLNERITVGAASTRLDSSAFPNAAVLKEPHNMGRLRISNLRGDTDGDGDFDELYAVGARSFSIFNATTGALVFDSGDAFEKITSTDLQTAPIFNADNEGNGFKGRSRAKGPEPEGVTIARFNEQVYAFISLERIGGVMVYDITNPAQPVFVDYKNSRDNTVFAGDNGPEGIICVEANGKFYVITANEISGTLAIFEVKNVTTDAQEPSEALGMTLFPNPVSGNVVYFNQVTDAQVFNLAGQQVLAGSNTNRLNVATLSNGLYLVRFSNGQVQKMVIQR